jgi:hypothetical protein
LVANPQSGFAYGKPGFAQQNAPKKRKGKPDGKANTTSSRVCQAPPPYLRQHPEI